MKRLLGIFSLLAAFTFVLGGLGALNASQTGGILPDVQAAQSDCEDEDATNPDGTMCAVSVGGVALPTHATLACGGEKKSGKSKDDKKKKKAEEET